MQVVFESRDQDAAHFRELVENALTRAARGLVRALQRGRSLERPRTRALRLQR